VGHLVLIGSSGVPGREHTDWERLKWPVVGELMITLARRSDIAKGMKEAVFRPDSVTDQDIDELWMPMRQSQVKQAQVGFMRGLDWRETAGKTSKASMPTLILWGVGDKYVTLGSQQTLQRLLPNASLMQIHNAGHVAHEDQPEIVNLMISDFISGRVVK
jgi:pimeloyl-ACP methyl ester carboxylesterase